MFWDIFSSGNTLKKTTDAIINTGDKLFLTEEEKLDYKQKYTEFIPTILKAFEPFKIAQRILAWWFSFLFGISFIMSLGIFVFNAIIKYQGLKSGMKIDNIVLIDLKPMYDILIAFDMPLIMSAIIGFYFLGGTISSFKKDR